MADLAAGTLSQVRFLCGIASQADFRTVRASRWCPHLNLHEALIRVRTLAAVLSFIRVFSVTLLKSTSQSVLQDSSGLNSMIKYNSGCRSRSLSAGISKFIYNQAAAAPAPARC